MNKQTPLYDGMVVLDNPIDIKTDDDSIKTIYGLLFEKEVKHEDDLWTWCLNRYLAYLTGAQNIQNNGGSIAPELIITSSGNMINLSNEIKNLIYRTMRDKISSYRIIEYEEPIQINSKEHDEIYIISKDILKRYQVNNTTKKSRI